MNVRENVSILSGEKALGGHSSVQEDDKLTQIMNHPDWRCLRLDKRNSGEINTYIRLSDNSKMIFKLANSVPAKTLLKRGIHKDVVKSWPCKSVPRDSVPCFFKCLRIAWGESRDLKYLGNGAFGTVKFAFAENVETNESQLCAAKKIKLSEEDCISRADVLREYNCQLQAGSLALSVYGISFTESCAGVPQAVIFMELGDGWTVEKLLRDDPAFSNKMHKSSRKGLTVDVIKICMDMHDSGIFHRDIKSSNVMVVSSGSGVLLKIIDFGMATTKEQFQCEYSTIPLYSAPELFNEMGNSRLIDVFSLGGLLFNIIVDGAEIFVSHERDCCKHYFTSTERDLKESVIKKRLDNQDFRPSGMRDLLGAMMHSNPSERPQLQYVYAQFCEWKKDYDNWT